MGVPPLPVSLPGSFFPVFALAWTFFVLSLPRSRPCSCFFLPCHSSILALLLSLFVGVFVDSQQQLLLLLACKINTEKERK